MTTKSRPRGGSSKSATEQPEDQGPAVADDNQLAPDEQNKAAGLQSHEEQARTSEQAQADAPERTPGTDNTGKDADQTGEQPEWVSSHGVNAAGPGPSIAVQAAMTSPVTVSGEPQPETVDQALVNDETGLSPAIPDPIPDTAATGDTERNGQPTAIGTDTTGELRKTDAVVTAAHGGDARNGRPDRMLADQVSYEPGGNGEAAAHLQNDGTRAETGTGTGTPAPEVEQVQYPSTTLTRATSSATPMEPEDVRRVTEPRLGDVATSTDPTMAAATMPSMPGDQTVALVNQKGEEVKPSEFFEVPEGAEGRGFRRVKMRVSEVYTVRRASTPGRRLLFTDGQLVPAAEAEAMIALHG